MTQLERAGVDTALVEQAISPVGAPVDVRTRRRPRRSSSRWANVLHLAPAVLFIVLAVVGPWITPWSSTTVVADPSIQPNAAHLFGTDTNGLDVFSRVLAAARNDIQIALITAVFATVAGICLGLAIGMNESKPSLPGAVARFFARALDLMQAIPSVVIGLVLVAFFGPSVPTLVIALTILNIPIQARLVRTEVLKSRSEAYLDAARMAGDSEFTLSVRHVLPNSSWPALENSTAVFSVAILLTSTLGFLGVGLQPPTPEWGSMIAAGASDATVGRWWSALFPALALTLCVVVFANTGHRLFGRKR